MNTLSLRRASRLLVALALVAASFAATSFVAAPSSAQVLAPAPAPGAGPTVKMSVSLNHGAVLVGGDGVNHLRILLEAERVKLEKRLPLNIVLVIDRSGSMAGDKIRNVREAAKFVIDELQDGDVVSVISFDNGAEVLQAAAPIESIDRAKVKKAIDRLTDRGGTDMVAGLRTGLAEAKKNAGTDRVNRIILLSDGRPNTETGLVDLAGGGLKSGIYLTTMGVGRDYNEDLMARLADAGSGNYYFIEKAEAVAGIFQQELKDLMSAVAREGVVIVQCAPGVQVVEVFGYESTPRKDGGVTIPVGDLFGGRSADILVRLKTADPSKAGEMKLADVRFSYHDAVRNEAATAERTVSQTLTADKKAIEAQTDAEVGAKVVRVQAAQAKQEAMTLYEQGKREEAKKVLQSAAKGARAATRSGAAAPAAAQEAEELDSLMGDIEATPASGGAAKSIRKKAKAEARDAMRRK